MSKAEHHIIQSSASVDEAMELTGRTEVIMFHGFVEVQPTEEYHWEVVQGDEFERVLAVYKSYHFFNNADQLFKHLPSMPTEAWRRLDLVLVDLSVNSVFAHQRTRRVTLADVDWQAGDAHVFGQNDEILKVYTPCKPWSV